MQQIGTRHCYCDKEELVFTQVFLQQVVFCVYEMGEDPGGFYIESVSF